MSTTREPVPAPGLRGARSAARLISGRRRSDGLQRLTDLAAGLLGTSDDTLSVQVSLLSDEQTIAARSGPLAAPAGSRGPLSDSLCTVTVELGGPLLVERAPQDDRVRHLPPVTSGAVSSYAGVPLVAADGECVGALCAFGSQPRTWREQDVAVLQELAVAVVAQLELDALTGEYQASQVRWEVALEAAGIGSFDWDLQTDRLDWDERMQELFGFSPGEFTPHIDTGFERLHPEDRPSVEVAIAAAVEACGDYRAEFRVVMPNSQHRWVGARGRAIAGPDGTAAQLIGTAYDITEVRTARDEAARLLETMATGFAALDRDWRVTYINSEGSRVVNMSAEHMVGKVLWELFPGLEQTAFGERYRHAVATGETVELEAYYAHLDGWFEVRAVPDSTGLGLYFLDVTDRHNSQQQAEAATRRLELLAAVSAELAAAGLDVEAAVARLAPVVVPVLADWCVFSVVDDDGRFRDVGAWHEDPEQREHLAVLVKERATDRIAPGAVAEVMVTRAPVVVAGGLATLSPTAPDSHEASCAAVRARAALAPDSAVVVPLMARGKVVGILTAVRSTGRRAMSDEERTTVREIAVRAGSALDSAQLYAAQHALSEGLQRSLLTRPPEPDHCEIKVRYVPAAEVASVGGDWFDAFLQPDGATVLVIGDVMGHDVAATAAMGQLRGLLRGIAWHSGDAPAAVLSGLDAAMQGLEVDTTATAVVARLEQDADERARGVTRLRWSNAGHPPPMVVQPDGSVLVLGESEVDLLLGIDQHTPRIESLVALDRGATVLLYTDGLVERRGQDLDSGLAELRTVLGELCALPLDDLCDQLLHRMLPSSVEDDVALVAVRLHRQDRPRPAEAGPERLPGDDQGA